MNKVLLLLCVAVWALAAIGAIVPVKYLPIDVDVETLNQVEIPGAQAIQYYDIRGTSNEMLMAEMKKQQNIIGGYAVTYYDVRYTVWAQNAGTPECKIEKWEVPYSVSVFMPRWTNPQDAPLSIVWIWKDWLRQAAAHEGHHVNIVLEGVEKVKGVIASSTCENVKERVEAAVQEIHRLQKEYDIQTGNVSSKEKPKSD